MTPTIIDRKTIPPDLESVINYCKQRQNEVDPQLFHDHYEAKGWMIGKSKMKDWQAAIRTWERNGFSVGEIKLSTCVIFAIASASDRFDMQSTFEPFFSSRRIYLARNALDVFDSLESQGGVCSIA